jgi:serine/threonine protein kinase/tetratricopeptide (TPR) repeat protein
MIGPYRILRRVGEGGMGEVYEAEQTRPVRRKVAIKIVKWGMDTSQVVARFKAEEQALALMNHPNIARVFDAGETERGRPFFAMEYVEGVPITHYCDTHKLNTRERLKIFMQVCEGVHHAHQKGIIHRDIKATNVLVKIQDQKPVPMIIDFGVAKATAHKLTEKTVYTEFGQLIGTPAYMSPEQAEMTGLDIDTRTDVYSLGVLLYELLVGVLPFDPTELRESGFDEIRRKIREDDPLRPSTRITSLGDASTDLAARRRTEPAVLVKRLEGDLDWITLKALDKDRTRRYDSASALAADIDRHMCDQPVIAGPPSTTYRLRKFIRRHKVGVAAAALVTVALLLGIVGTTAGLLRATRAERAATEEAETARQVSDFLIGLFDVSDPGEARGNTITAREILDEGAAKISAELSGQPAVQATLMNTMGRVYMKLGLYDQAGPLLDQAVEIARGVHGDNHPDLAAALRNLGILYDTEGRYEEAEGAFEQSLAIYEQLLGPDHLEVASALNSLAIAHWNQGESSEALPAFERSLAIKERALGPNDAELCTTLSNLGMLHHSEGNFEEAEPLLRRALAVAEQTLEPDHPDIAGYLNNLGSLLQDSGRDAEAEPLYERSLAIWEKTLGNEHPDVGIGLHNLGNLNRDQGEYEVAEAYYLRSLPIWENALGSSHYYVGISLRERAHLYYLEGRHSEAEPLFARSLTILEGALGPDHPQVAGTLQVYALLLRELDRDQEAEELEARAREIGGSV